METTPSQGDLTVCINDDLFFKPMMIVSTTDYIVSVLGPYLADPKKPPTILLFLIIEYIPTQKK